MRKLRLKMKSKIVWLFFFWVVSLSWFYPLKIEATFLLLSDGSDGPFHPNYSETLPVPPDGLLSCASGAGGVRSSDGTLTHFGGDGGQGYLLFNADSSIVDGLTVGILMQWPLCLADLDGDNDIDGSDLNIMAIDFLRTDCDVPPGCRGDLEPDGGMDALDLIMFAPYYGSFQCMDSN